MEENKQIIVSKEESTLLPIADNYIKMFPEILDDKTFNAKQSMISLALKMKATKDKTGRSAIDVCSKESVMQVAQEILSKRVDPMKSQCALIVYGTTLTLQIQYQGNVKRALELCPYIDHFNFVPIYAKDKIKITIKDGKYCVASHETDFLNMNNEDLVGGYVDTINKKGEIIYTEIWNKEMLFNAWSNAKNGTAVHKKYPFKMVRKTILNSVALWYINQSGEKTNSDETDFVDDIEENGTEVQEEDVNFEQTDNTPQEIKEDIKETQQETTQDTNDEWTEDDMNEAMDSTKENENKKTVPYKEWLNKYKDTNEWKMINGTYDTNTKTVDIEKIEK